MSPIRVKRQMHLKVISSKKVISLDRDISPVRVAISLVRAISVKAVISVRVVTSVKVVTNSARAVISLAITSATSSRRLLMNSKILMPKAHR